DGIRDYKVTGVQTCALPICVLGRLEHHHQTVAEALQRGGHEVKSLGDGLMVVFESAKDALAAAVSMQQAVADHNRLHPETVFAEIGRASCRERGSVRGVAES